MAHRVVLHAGLMKSGTSYLQQRLFANRELLHDQGLLLPGERWRDQVLAVSDVLGRQAAGPEAEGRWQRLLDEVAAHPGDVLVSMEFLGPAPPERIAAVVDSIDAPVEAVLTLRDLGRGVPAMWQESLQNGGTLAWHEYVDRLDGRQRPAQAFWRQQGMARIVGNWVSALGADGVTLVTVPVPGSPPGELWRRFGLAAGFDGAASADVPPANTSLDAASATVLLDLNRRLEEDRLSPGDRRTLVKFALAKRAMAGRPGDPIGFEPPPWLVERAGAIRKRLAATGARVVGDLDDLEPAPVPGVDPDHVPAEERLAAAVDALRSVTLRAARDRRGAQSTGSTTTRDTA